MANCSECGKPLQPGSAFCVFCGARASAPPVSLPGLDPAPAPRRGFLRSLFDLSFTSLVTTKIIKMLYVLWMIVIGLLAIAFVVVAFRVNSTLGAVVLLVVAPVAALFYLVCVRVGLELVIALFRVMENTSELVAQGRRGG